MIKYLVRKSFKDIFGIYALDGESFDGKYDMPICCCFDDLSKIDYLALYSDIKEYKKTENTCVCFYQYDHVFDGPRGLYNSIIYKDKVVLDRFRKRFEGVKYIIAPDYSIFGDFPNALQISNIYKSRFCARWLTKNTNAVLIPNVRWSFDFSYEYCFDGISKGSNIAIGLLGQIKNKENKKMFLDGFKRAIDIIQPKQILVYGFVNELDFDEFFSYAKSKGALIIIPHSKIDIYKKEGAIYGTR